MLKQILMIAGPNGAGKTTLSKNLFSQNKPVLYEFINADEIARGLAPLNPDSVSLTASKLMIQRFRQLLQDNKSFAFETTAAGTNYVKHLKNAKSQGYEVNLAFLWLDDPDQAIARVAQRVKQGGHHIPRDVIVRRYYAGGKNFLLHYLPIADSVVVINNSPHVTSTALIAKKDSQHPLQIVDIHLWEQLQKRFL
jgi:predicted ABC-type ATPase